jgi:DNA-binding transcriptional LysR family regulator
MVRSSPFLPQYTFYTFAILVVVANGHPTADTERIEPKRLRDQPRVAFPPRQGATPVSFGLVLRQGLAVARRDEAEIVVIDSLTAQKRLVEAGFGLALVPVRGLQVELQLPTQTRLDVPAMEALVDVTLIHRKGAFLSAGARRLMEMPSRKTSATV